MARIATLRDLIKELNKKKVICDNSEEVELKVQELKEKGLDDKIHQMVAHIRYAFKSERVYTPKDILSDEDLLLFEAITDIAMTSFDIKVVKPETTLQRVMAKIKAGEVIRAADKKK